MLNNKSTKEQIQDYRTKIQNINLKKINAVIDILSVTNDVLLAYDRCKDFYEEEYELSNNLCISNIHNIREYMFNYAKNSSEYIEDEKILFDTLAKLKQSYNMI